MASRKFYMVTTTVNDRHLISGPFCTRGNAEQAATAVLTGGQAVAANIMDVPELRDMLTKVSGYQFQNEMKRMNLLANKTPA